MNDRVKRVFKWLRWLKYREARRLSDYRAMSNALRIAGRSDMRGRLSGAPLARGKG